VATRAGERPALERVVVVGGSLAGLRACESLRRHGFEGTIVLLGAERHLPYDRPPLSKQFLAGAWDRERIALVAEDKFAALGLEVHLGTAARGLDLARRAVLLEEGEEVRFDGLVIATGATPRRLRDAGELDGVVTVRTLDDATALRERLVREGARLAVVGGGFLGMEVAATARGLGAEVTVIEPLPAPLARAVGPLVGETLAGMHRDHGVRVVCGRSVRELVGSARVEGVRLDDGTLVPADVVLVAIGVVPATRWLEGSELALDDGVLCDGALVAAPGVVAAGDVARWPYAHGPAGGRPIRLEHWTNAAEQGVHAGASLLLPPGERSAFGPVPYFWSDHFDVKIQAIGLPGPDDEVQVVEGSLEERRFVALYGRGGRLAAALGFGRPRQLMAFRPLVERGAPFDEALRHRPG